MASVIALFFELGMLMIIGLIRFTLFLIRRFDVTNGLLLSGLIQLVNVNRDWTASLRWILFFVVLGASLLIQHYSIIGKVLFAVFSSVSAGLLGAVWMQYDSNATRYTVMVVCFTVVAILNYASWTGMKEESAVKLQVV